MDDLYRAGITDLDNVEPQLYQRILDRWPALLDVSEHDLANRLMIEAAAVNPDGDYATPAACNVVAERWMTQCVAIRAA